MSKTFTIASILALSIAGLGLTTVPASAEHPRNGQCFDAYPGNDMQSRASYQACLTDAGK